VAKEQNSSSSSAKKSARQEEFEREAREKLENADMRVFDKFIKRLIETPTRSLKDKTATQK
jgi:hypothetical protein